MLENGIVVHLQQAGASVVGFADLSPLPEQATGNLKSAISVGIALNPRRDHLRDLHLRVPLDTAVPAAQRSGSARNLK